MNPPANQRPQLVMKTVFFPCFLAHVPFILVAPCVKYFKQHPTPAHYAHWMHSFPSLTHSKWNGKKEMSPFFFFFFSFFRVWGTRASSSMNETGANGVADRSGLVSPMRNFANLCAIFFKNQKFNAAVSSSDSNVAFRSEKQTVTDIWYPHNPQSEPVERIPAVFFFKLC